MTMQVIQGAYTTSQPRGEKGRIAYENQSSVTHVFRAGEDMKPGDLVIWNATNNNVETADSAADLLIAIGILGWERASVNETDGTLEIKEGKLCDIIAEGSVWLEAGGAIENFSLAGWNTTNEDFRSYTVPADANVDDIPRIRIQCVTATATADGDLFVARISPW